MTWHQVAPGMYPCVAVGGPSDGLEFTFRARAGYGLPVVLKISDPVHAAAVRPSDVHHTTLSVTDSSVYVLQVNIGGQLERDGQHRATYAHQANP